MKIWLGSDHAGFQLKEQIKKWLIENQYELEDCGTTSIDSVDYPDYAFAVGKHVVESEENKGILICGTGIGISIACNKIRHVRCAKISSVEESYLSRSHNDANVIAFSSKMDFELVKECLNTFLTTPFSGEERHQRRIEKIRTIEESYDN